MGVVHLTFSQAVADEISTKLEIALTPAPLTLEERVAALEARKVWEMKTGPYAEQVENIVATEGQPYSFYVLYSVPLPSINAGDKIKAECQFQVTHIEIDNSARYMVGKWLCLGNSPTDTSGPQLNRPSGLNVERLRTHEPIHHFGSLIATEAMTGKYLNAIVYSQRLGAAGNGIIRVDQNYGHLETSVIPALMLS